MRHALSVYTVRWKRINQALDFFLWPFPQGHTRRRWLLSCPGPQQVLKRIQAPSVIKAHSLRLTAANMTIEPLHTSAVIWPGSMDPVTSRSSVTVPGCLLERVLIVKVPICGSASASLLSEVRWVKQQKPIVGNYGVNICTSISARRATVFSCNRAPPRPKLYSVP